MLLCSFPGNTIKARSQSLSAARPPSLPPPPLSQHPSSTFSPLLRRYTSGSPFFLSSPPLSSVTSRICISGDFVDRSLKPSFHDNVQKKSVCVLGGHGVGGVQRSVTQHHQQTDVTNVPCHRNDERREKNIYREARTPGETETGSSRVLPTPVSSPVQTDPPHLTPRSVIPLLPLTSEAPPLRAPLVHCDEY